MVGLAEERGQVGGQGIGEGLPLVLVIACFQLIQVVLERAQSQTAETARQSSIDHVALGRHQGDAARR